VPPHAKRSEASPESVAFRVTPGFLIKSAGCASDLVHTGISSAVPSLRSGLWQAAQGTPESLNSGFLGTPLRRPLSASTSLVTLDQNVLQGLLRELLGHHTTIA
jgi:hypothetical protein